MKLLIKNSTIHNHNDSFKADILIENEKISRIADNIKPDADCKIIDCEYMFALPGGVDVHTHLNLKLGDKKVSDGFFNGTLSAAFGGTTTIVDHPEGCENKCSLLTKPNEYKEKLEKEAVIDFGIHGVFQRLDNDILEEIPELINSGFYSAKIYTTYDIMLDYPDIELIVKKINNYNGLVCFHAEDNNSIFLEKEKYIKDKKFEPIYHPLSRKDDAEQIAIKKIAQIIKKYDAKAYIVHLSSEKGLIEIEKSIDAGIKIIAETCPQYLLLDDSYYSNLDGLKYVISPPLRKEKDIKALWNGIKQGLIKVIATDHCSFSYADKLKYGKNNVFNCPGGFAGVETRMPLIYTEFAKRNIGINKFVELSCYNPAKIMGFSNLKGSIEIGKDADIVIWNPNLEKVIKKDNLHQHTDYCPYENFKVSAYPIITILRGKTIIKDGIFFAGDSYGKFIHRKSL